MLQDESLAILIDAIPCREAQIRQLATIFCQQNFLSPSTTVVYGVKSTGKSLTIKSVLESCYITRHAIIQSTDWVDSRELLEAVISAVVNMSKKEEEEEEVEEGEEEEEGEEKEQVKEVEEANNINKEHIDGRGCESISAFVVQLQLLLEGKGKTILVFDGIDRQQEPWPSLLPAIARLGEIIPNLSVILVVTSSSARLLQLTGVPHIHFPPYTRAESIQIVSSSSSPLPLGNHISQSETDWLWTTFCGIVWDSMGKAVVRELLAFHDVCQRIWRPFVQPIISGDYAPRELHKLMIKNRTLFQGDKMIEPEINPWKIKGRPRMRKKRRLLPIFATYLLIAAYLASHTPARTDCLRFSKFHQSRYKRKAGSNYPKVSKSSSRRRKVPCHLLGPAAFPAERLYAIYHAILPPNLYTRAADLNLDEAVAVLWGKRLLVKSMGGGDNDVLSCKWRIGVGLEFITGIANDVAFDLDDYLWD